jgi:hypothetical protein
MCERKLTSGRLVWRIVYALLLAMSGSTACLLLLAMSGSTACLLRAFVRGATAFSKTLNHPPALRRRASSAPQLPRPAEQPELMQRVPLRVKFGTASEAA